MHADLIQSWGNRARRYWFEAVGIAGSLASIIALVVVYRSSEAESLLGWYLIAVTTGFAAFAVWRELHYARKVVYAEILPHLHHTVHQIRDRLDGAEAIPDADFTRDIRDLMDVLALAFSIITRTGCRACIKVLAVHPNAPDLSSLGPRDRTRHLLVRTFVRDSINTVPPETERADFLDGNSDLCELFADPTQRDFTENDLPKRYAKGGYHNSHLPPAGFEKWPLPYRSAMVWPIRKKDLESTLHPGHELLGFLCVDSGTERVFVRRYDFDVGALVADALYIYMKTRFERRANGGGNAA